MSIASANIRPQTTRVRSIGPPGESRVLDTDDIGRVWRAVIAALRTLGFRVRRVEPSGWAAVTFVPREGCSHSLKAQVRPHGDAQLIVSLEPVPHAAKGSEPVPYGSFFEMVARDLPDRAPALISPGREDTKEGTWNAVERVRLRLCCRC